MGDMFRASSTNVFNQPINTSGTSWDVSKVTNMAGMFRNCSQNVMWVARLQCTFTAK
jgi:hypothetical protein